MKKILIFMILALAFACSDTEKKEDDTKQKLIGYVPIWNSGAPVYSIESNIKKIDFSKLTHVIISFIFSDAGGNIRFYENNVTGAWSPENTVDSIIAIAKKNDVKVLISLGSDADGWNMTLNADARTNFTKNVKELLINKNLDGLDLDLEGGWGQDAPFHSDEYILLAQELRDSLKNDFYLTAAVGAIHDNIWKPEFVQIMDWINIMVYDLHLWTPNDIQNPSSFEDQINSANIWSKHLDKKKLVFGVPFYSNGWNYDGNKRYANEINWWHATGNTDSSSWAWFPNEVFNYFVLDSLFKPHPDADSILVSKDDKLWFDVKDSNMGFRGSHNGIIYLNGRTTLKRKARWAIDNGYGGIMIWELTGDVASSHPRSLLSALAEEF